MLIPSPRGCEEATRSRRRARLDEDLARAARERLRARASQRRGRPRNDLAVETGRRVALGFGEGQRAGSPARGTGQQHVEIRFRADSAVRLMTPRAVAEAPGCTPGPPHRREQRVDAWVAVRRHRLGDLHGAAPGDPSVCIDERDAARAVGRRQRQAHRRSSPRIAVSDAAPRRSGLPRATQSRQQRHSASDRIVRGTERRAATPRQVVAPPRGVSSAAPRDTAAVVRRRARARRSRRVEPAHALEPTRRARRRRGTGCAGGRRAGRRAAGRRPNCVTRASCDQRSTPGAKTGVSSRAPRAARAAAW